MKLLSCCFLHSILCNEILSQVSKNRFLPSTVSSADMLNDELKRRMTHSQGGLTPTAQRKGEGFLFAIVHLIFRSFRLFSLFLFCLRGKCRDITLVVPSQSFSRPTLH